MENRQENMGETPFSREAESSAYRAAEQLGRMASTASAKFDAAVDRLANSATDPLAQSAGERAASQVGRLAGTASAKFDSSVDYLEETAQSFKRTYQRVSDEGWEGLKKRAVEYTRQEPLNALLMAVGAGILVGWATKRGKV
jgi:hypothetical protein